MFVNRRLVLFAISALILAFIINQAISLAQESVLSSLQVGENEQLTTAPAAVIKAITTATSAETAKELPQLEKVPRETYGGEEGRLLEQREFSLLLNVIFSLVVAAGAFFLVRRAKLK